MEKEILFDSDLHFEHNQWNSEISFWEVELKSFKNQLSKFVNRWTDKNTLAQLEHFQNQFILHGEVLDIMKHDIHLHESNMSAHDVKNENAMDSSLVKKHIAFRSRMETQRSIYGDLKKEFFAFLSKNR